MVDLTATQARATTSRERGQCPAFTRASQNVATAAMLLDTLPPPSTDRVDGLHRQLGEIITIATTQLEECARWCWTRDSPSSVDRSRADWRKATVEPSTVGAVCSSA
jgi:hypothetical protein